MCYDTICLSGGGINGLNMLGSLKYLNDNNIIQMKKLNTFIGTSVGSLINLLLVLNYKINTIIKIVYKLDFNKIELDFDLDNFLENYGIDNASRILTIMQTLLFNKTGYYDLKFIDLYNLTKKNLKILVVNYSQKREELLSYETTPEMSVILAIRMSISIPLVFYPVTYNNDYYIDGGMINNFGFKYCNPKTTIGICIETEIDKKPKDLITFIRGLLNIIEKVVTFNNFNNTNIIILKSKSSLTEFALSKESKYKLIKNGYKNTKKIAKVNINFFAEKFVNDIIDEAISLF